MIFYTKKPLTLAEQVESARVVMKLARHMRKKQSGFNRPNARFNGETRLESDDETTRPEYGALLTETMPPQFP